MKPKNNRFIDEFDVSVLMLLGNIEQALGLGHLRTDKGAA